MSVNMMAASRRSLSLMPRDPGSRRLWEVQPATERLEAAAHGPEDLVPGMYPVVDALPLKRALDELGSPTRHELGPLGRTVSTHIGSLKSGPRTFDGIV
jgi:hypothetical protein